MWILTFHAAIRLRHEGLIPISTIDVVAVWRETLCMNLASLMTRTPRPFDPDKGWETAARVPGVSTEVSALLCGTAGCSPYLATLIEKEALWLSEAVENPVDAVAEEIVRARAFSIEALEQNLRQSKRRIALMVALLDLSGAWSLEHVTGSLTKFADAACEAAMRGGLLRQIRRGKLPGMAEENAHTGAGMFVLAMGKMGAGELNYSSDIDLICLFDESQFAVEDFQEARAAFGRATRAMAATLSEITSEGYVFRTDLRLRPDPSVTPVCIAMDAAEQYYESLGRTWERAAYIKARTSAGDHKAGHRFLEALRPFVWRRHLDFAAIQDAHDMRLAIREHKGLGGAITLPGHNMKLGRGGIREIEFFTQTRQLIAGGRDPDLRCRGTVKGLKVLAEKGWIDADVSTRLQSHYVAHRTVEHRLQMVRDAQTHSLPRSDDEFDRLAALMDLDSVDLRKDLLHRLADVHELTEGFFAPAKSTDTKTEAELDQSILDRWISYPALRSARSRQIFERVKPELQGRLAAAARPKEALLAFDGFLSGLPAGVQLFSLLEANPQLTDLIIDITGTSPALAQYLSKNASVFDAVIGGDFFSDWPGRDGLESFLSEQLGIDTDYERKLDAARRWFKEWHFRVGVHLLRGLISADEAKRQYTDLARAILGQLWPCVVEEFARKHGPPPGRGGAVIGMGSLGGATLNAGSDLDLIVVYDPMDEDVSEGKRPLNTRPYYARLTQALITALTAPMAQGKLFEVDMRLRPSGNQGPVATSWQAFQSYQRNEAWVWEHLALTRAVCVAGPDALCHDIKLFQSDLLKDMADTEKVVAEVATMCARIRQAKTPSGLWDVKIGPGRLQEIELIAQAGTLLEGEPGERRASGLSNAAQAGIISPDDAELLLQSADLMSDLNTVLRLLSDKPLSGEMLGPAATAFVLRTTNSDTLEALEAEMLDSYSKGAEILDRALGRYFTDGAENEG